jgi:hypothetical protein
MRDVVRRREDGAKSMRFEGDGDKGNQIIFLGRDG